MTGSLGPGPELPGYTWVRRLGWGGFADVHLYRQESPARDVAVKLLRDPGDATASAALAREANAMASVAGHPSVLPLYAVGRAPDGRPYLVTEYCPVPNLGALVRDQPLTVPRALEVLVQLGSAVEALHRRGLVHRDIKPGNVMLTRWNRPALSDFGTCAPLGSPHAGGISVAWAPPEQQQRDSRAHPTQDVWALGATGWALLSGRGPFELAGGDNTTQAIAARVRAGRLPRLPDQVPPVVADVLLGALTVSADRRTSSAADFVTALQAAQGALGLPVTEHVFTAGGELAAGAPARAASEDATGPAVYEVSGDATVLADADLSEDADVPEDAVSEDPDITLPPGALAGDATPSSAVADPASVRPVPASTPPDVAVAAASLSALGPAPTPAPGPAPEAAPAHSGPGSAGRARPTRPGRGPRLAGPGRAPAPAAAHALPGAARSAATPGVRALPREPRAKPVRRRRITDPTSGVRSWVVGVLLLVAVLATAGVVASWLQGGVAAGPPPARTTPQPQDPVGAPPTPVAGLTAQVREGRTWWSWQPDGAPRRYVVTLTRPGVDALTRATDLSALDFEAVPGSNCLAIVAVDADGRESSVSEHCVEVAG